MQRFVGMEQAQWLCMIDLDSVEYDAATKTPLALIETAVDNDQAFKPATVTENLARLANIPCYVLLYKLADEANPADPKWQDIKEFRYMRRHPNPMREWVRCSTHEWSQVLVSLRQSVARKADDMADFWKSLEAA